MKSISGDVMGRRGGCSVVTRIHVRAVPSGGPTNAGSPSRVHGHATGALADERSHRVHTLAIDANAREHFTLIHIYQQRREELKAVCVNSLTLIKDRNRLLMQCNFDKLLRIVQINMMGRSIRTHWNVFSLLSHSVLLSGLTFTYWSLNSGKPFCAEWIWKRKKKKHSFSNTTENAHAYFRHTDLQIDVHLTWLTLGTGTAPSLAKRGTAVGLQGGSINVDLTAAIHYLHPTSSFAGLCWFTVQIRVTLRIYLTQPIKRRHLEYICKTLFLSKLWCRTNALRSRAVQRAANWALAQEGPGAVLAAAVHTRTRFTLVNVCIENTRPK